MAWRSHIQICNICLKPAVNSTGIGWSKFNLPVSNTFGGECCLQPCGKLMKSQIRWTAPTYNIHLMTHTFFIVLLIQTVAWLIQRDGTYCSTYVHVMLQWSRHIPSRAYPSAHPHVSTLISCSSMDLIGIALWTTFSYKIHVTLTDY